MTDPKILRYFGTTNEALRAFFTCDKNPQADPRMAEAKRKFTKWVSNILIAGRDHSTRYYRFYAAADLMWDSTPILPEAVPLMAYAQGKIDLAVAEKALGPAASRFIEEVPGTPPPAPAPTPPGAPITPPPSAPASEPKKRLNLQKLHEVVVNIGRSYITRRVDAQCNQYNNLRPQFKYDPRDGSLVGRCRADAMSEYADIMAEGYAYPHLQRQAIRDMLMYGRSVMFPECAWDRDTTMDFAGDGEEGPGISEMAGYEPDGAGGQKKVKRRIKTRVTREGVPMVNIHPSKVIYDASQPLATINTDTGCSYIGYWDVKRFSEIKSNPLFFNTDRVTFSSGAGGFYSQHRAFFDLLYGDQPINFPSTLSSSGNPNAAANAPAGAAPVDLAARNDRQAQTTFYDDVHSNSAVFVQSLRIKVTPSDWFGLGEYSKPVWLHLHVAGDDTVIFAEWMPSLPAIYWGHNENDAKMVSLGQMHEIMPWQDQLTNIFSQLLMVMKRTLAQIIVVNTDLINDENGSNALAKLEADLKGDNFYQSPKLLKVSMKTLEKLGISFDAVIKIVEPNPLDAEYVMNAFKAISQILMILERLMMMSPQEQGQAAKHELSATESAVIQNTTQVKFESISESVNEARAAWKRLIFESGQAYGSEQVELWVTQRYPDNIVKAAGFNVTEKTVDPADTDKSAVQSKGRLLLGTKRSLVHNYTFTSRDGANRFTDQQAANTLVQAMGSLLPLVGAQSLGKERIFLVFNSVLRLLGLPTDLMLRIEPNEDMRVGEDAGAEPQGNEQRMAAIEQALQALAGSQGQFSEQIQQLTATMQQVLQGASNAPATPAPALPPV